LMLCSLDNLLDLCLECFLDSTSSHWFSSITPSESNSGCLVLSSWPSVHLWSRMMCLLHLEFFDLAILWIILTQSLGFWSLLSAFWIWLFVHLHLTWLTPYGALWSWRLLSRMDSGTL
jgi:hypothetical protein